MINPNNDVVYLPQWYVEDRFLHSEAIRALSDNTENLTFARLFLNPSNPTHRDTNHLHMDFFNLEFPTAGPVALADPPENIAHITKVTYKTQGLVPRCTIDTTLHHPQQIIKGFDDCGFALERDLNDTVMKIDGLEPSEFKTSKRVRRCSEGDIRELAKCNARCFGYDKQGDTAWLDEKLRRQVLNNDTQVWMLEEKAFAVVFVPREKAPKLAYLQVVGTHPDHRRQGLASEIIQHALAHLVPGMRVYLDAFEEGPIRMYERLGFAKVGNVITTECTWHGPKTIEIKA
ncbi:hypothetical protein EC988_000585 [Linderina pennispora]|nr:hypothetical protein EC988_000585 [Linderina pennispora]